MKIRNCFFLAFMLVISIACKKNDISVKSITISLQPNYVEGKDAFVEDYPYEDYRNKNWGDSEEFAAISWTSNGIPFVVRSFIDFNFDAVPTYATVDSAKLSLFAYGNNKHGIGHDASDGTNECYLYRVTGEWEENLVTWNTQPSVADSNKVLLPGSNETMQDYIDIDVTNLVRDIIMDRENSYGFMLRLKYESGYRRMFFATSDAEEINKRPKLDIYYTVEE